MEKSFTNFEKVAKAITYPKCHNIPCLLRDKLVIPDVNKKMTSFIGQARWAKMTSPGGKQKALALHPTKKVNKAE